MHVPGALPLEKKGSADVSFGVLGVPTFIEMGSLPHDETSNLGVLANS